MSEANPASPASASLDEKAGDKATDEKAGDERPDTRTDTKALSSAPDGTTPALRAAWFLRVTAMVAFVATVFGVLLMPGARGLLGDCVVVPLGRITWSLAYVMAGFSIAASILACFELSRAMRMAIGPRIVAIGAAGAALVFSAPSILLRLPTPVALAMSLATVIVTFACVWEGLRAPHTRAVAVIAGAFGVAAALRLVAWQVGTIAGDSANTRLYGVAQGVATAAVAFEGFGQMAAAAWLGREAAPSGKGCRRPRWPWLSSSRGEPRTGPRRALRAWQAGLHTALANAAGLPPPGALRPLATFLVCASTPSGVRGGRSASPGLRRRVRALPRPFGAGERSTFRSTRSRRRQARSG